MITKNSLSEGEVTALGSDCEGIIKSGGTTAFVPFCLEGEKVEFRAEKVARGIVYGRLTRIITPSPARVSPPCPVFGKCGGCALQHADYAEQLEIKRAKVAGALKKIGGIDFDVSPCVPCAKPYRYRNKLILPVTGGKGDVKLGFFAPRSHRVVTADDCLIQSEWVKDVIYSVKKFARLQNLSGYEDGVGGDIRRIMVRETDGKFIFALVAARRLDLKPFESILAERFENFTLSLNINPNPENSVFSDDWQTVRGTGFFISQASGIKYKAGANTFLQVNDDVRAKLYSRVLEEAPAGAAALDLYSGGGMLTAMLAKKCRFACGVEIVAEASRCADELKEMNGLENMLNICGKAEDEIERALSLSGDAEKFIVCDPPRKGMERSVVKAVARSGAEKIALISCNPATLARDLGIICGTLEERGGELIKTLPSNPPYKLISVTPFDMFPQTAHIETLVVLSHKKPDGHIGVKVEFGEEEGQISLKEVEKRAEERKPKEKVTYKMIQDYIEKTYGFKVHTAYIAEVKRDLGLPMYDAPNAVEELKRPRSHPSPQMVEAIKETLKHFEII